MYLQLNPIVKSLSCSVSSWVSSLNPTYILLLHFKRSLLQIVKCRRSLRSLRPTKTVTFKKIATGMSLLQIVKCRRSLRSLRHTKTKHPNVCYLWFCYFVFFISPHVMLSLFTGSTANGFPTALASSITSSSESALWNIMNSSISPL